jgi:phage gp16-like protein
MNHIAAIHVLKAQCKLSEDDYRALLVSLTGKDSCKAMHATQLAQVRSHLDNLAVRLGVATAKPAFVPNPQFTRQRAAGKRSGSDAQDERWAKARTLWAQLAQAGKVQADTDAALLAYVKRQTQLEAWRFLNGYQINMVIESLKRWLARVDVKVNEAA